MIWGLLASNVGWSLGGIAGILSVATVFVGVRTRLHPELDLTELRLRIRSWWMIAALFTVAIALGRAGTLVFFAFVSFLALKEYFSLIPTRRADRRMLVWAYLTIPIQYLWVALDWYDMFVIFIPVCMFMIMSTRMVIYGETTGFLRAAATLHWGVMAIVFSLGHAAYLLNIALQNSSAGGGMGLVLLLVCLTQFNDVAQYIFGKTFGTHKITPKVSPNKTLEGLIGGVVTTVTLAVALAPWLTPLTRGESLLAGLLIGLGGFAGDVMFSALKRDLAIKDCGTVIPGHGGILDRIDSLICTAPLFFHFVRYLHG